MKNSVTLAFQKALLVAASFAALTLAAATPLAPSPALASEVAGAPLTGEMKNFTLLGERKPVADIAFSGESDEKIALSAFRGKLILVNFWATWCAPCRKEMPQLDQLQAELGSDRFQVVAIGQDFGGMEKVAAFFEETGIEHLARYNDKTTQSGRSFGAYGLPLTVLVDAEGREIGRLVGPADWQSDEAKALIRHFLE